MTLELFTAFGALVGGSIAFLLDDQLLAFLFAALLLYVAVTMPAACAEAPSGGRARAGPARGHRRRPGARRRR